MPAKRRNAFDDPEDLKRRTAEKLAETAAKEAAKPQPKQRHKGTFVLVPRGWAQKLAASKATGNTWALVMAILYRNNLDKFRGTAFPIAAAVMREATISKQRKRSALDQLEALGLIEVQWRGNKAPLVTVRSFD